ncbi:hypothetical protein [uncultured Bacteroides sp.]|uniref:hypothetical protein n=1 Tax=uncultured Bacteroides sp. TaxID=162156 RepID=UPI00260FF55E|nr:hypothetical protein [uncultured Bacteroides sp.]
MLLTVYDSNRQAKAVLSPDDSSTQVKAIQSDNVLTLSFTLYEYVALEVNDYVDFEGERYWLQERYLPDERNTQEWKYDVKFYGIESLMRRFLVLNVVDGDPEPVFTLTAPPREHMALIVKSINDGMGGVTDWKVGRVEGTGNVVIDYEGKYCPDALKELAGKVPGAEWWVEGQTVNLCRCEHGEEVSLAYGKGLAELSRDKADGAKFYTRLFPIGSSRNIDPEKYGHSRLQLPDGAKYVDVNTEKYGIHHHYEKDAFADIYPRRVGTVTSVRSAQVTDEDGHPFVIWYFRDDTLNFDPNTYELAGKVKRVSFQEGGELAGLGEEEDGTYYFEVNFDSDTREFEIITIWPYDDDTQLPGGNLIPKTGDRYILWNIRMPDEYYALAEEEYLTAVNKYNAENAIDVSVYKGPTDHVYVERNKIDLYPGRRVRLESTEYFPETGFRSSRITKITRKVALPSQVDLEIGDALSTGVMESLKGSIEEVRNYTKTAGSNLPDIIRSWDNTLPTDNNLFSARRSQAEHLSKKKADRAKKKITFEEGIGIGQEENGGIDGKGNAELLTLVVREFLRSPQFVDGLLGEGWRLWMEDALSHLTIDKLTVRQVMVVLELLIEKVRSVGGQLCVSAANGKIKTALLEDGYWKITFEQDNSFQTHDLMRCATFSGGSLKGYWVEVAATEGNSILVCEDEFSGSFPEPGDECVLMGNTDNPLRQNLILISATEDGQPRMDVMDGVKAKNFTGCLRARLGNLDGISDDWFPADNQPHGNGLYSDNAYLRGTFLLVTGEDIKTKFEIVEGRITSVVTALRQDFATDRGYLNNPAFDDGLMKWNTENETGFFLVGNRWVWANGNVLTKKGDGASVTEDDGRKVVRIRNKYILQKRANLKSIPSMPENGSGEKEAVPVYLTFFYRCAVGGTLRVEFVGVDKTGFANFNSMEVEEELPATDGYVQYTCSGLWNGTGDFKLSFTGDIYLYMLILSTDRVESLTHRYKTLFEQSERLVKISAAVFDRDENFLQETGLVVKPEGAGIYAQDADGKLALIGVSVDETDADGNKISVVKLTGDHIKLEGLVTANENFKILEDGSIEAKNGKFTGEIDADTGKIGGFSISYGRIGIDKDGGGSGMFLYNSMIGFKGDNMQALIGCYNDLGTDILGRFVNTQSGYLPNYGLVFSVQNSLSNRNYAFVGTGDGILKGVVEGFRLNWIEFSQAKEAKYINLNRGKYVEVCGNYGDCVLMLPRLAELRLSLGMSSTSTEDIAVRLTVVKRSGSDVRLYGRTGDFTVNGSSVDNAQHPYFRDNNFGNTGYWNMGNGDVVEVLLTYSAAEYNAYTVSIHR